MVLQQGRVQVESDWNEQVAILLHAVRTLAADLIGPWGGTQGAFALAVSTDASADLELGAGVYYVDGIRVENDPGVRYLNQPYYRVPDRDKLTAPTSGTDNHLLYLDVFERLVTADEDASLLDVALGGLDTAARTQPVWQVRTARLTETALSGATCEKMPDLWATTLQDLIAKPQRGELRARARVRDEYIDQPCAIDPRASYRFDENALIRVEVHQGGPAGTATFKWSLDNGSVALAVTEFRGETLHLATLGRDPRLTLDVGDFVELESDDYVLQHEPAECLYRVTEVDRPALTVKVTPAPPVIPPDQHPRLRRWDQKNSTLTPLTDKGTVAIAESANADGPYIDLAHGVQVQFQQVAGTEYRSGDFWLIEARTAIGDVIWPQTQDTAGHVVPAALPPRGIEHHYAPLAWATVAANGAVKVEQSFVRHVNPPVACG
ncbi:hypothetical protein GCM10023199_44360 [Actinomycetospora chibensis]